MSELPLTKQEPSVALMLQGALSNIQSGQITPEHVDVLGKMMDLYERNEKRAAEKEFATALAALQADTQTVSASKPVNDRAGNLMYKFAPYEHIMKMVSPILTKHGFSISFDTKFSDGRLTSICTLMHKGGHARSNEFSARLSKPPNASDAQGDMATKTLAKRGALCDALNIVIEHDTDARLEGSAITKEQADELRKGVYLTKTDETKFLKFAGANTLEEIGDLRFDELKSYLAKKAARND